MTPQEIKSVTYDGESIRDQDGKALLHLAVWHDSKDADIDAMGQFITDAINEKIEREKPTEQDLCKHEWVTDYSGEKVKQYCDKCKLSLARHLAGPAK